MQNENCGLFYYLSLIICAKSVSDFSEHFFCKIFTLAADWKTLIELSFHVSRDGNTPAGGDLQILTILFKPKNVGLSKIHIKQHILSRTNF